MTTPPKNPKCPSCNEAVEPIHDPFFDNWIVPMCPSCVAEKRNAINQQRMRMELSEAARSIMTSCQLEEITEIMRTVDLRGDDGIGQNLAHIIDRWGSSRQWALLHGDTEAGKTTKMLMFGWLLIRKCLKNNTTVPSMAYTTGPLMADELTDFSTRGAGFRTYTNVDLLILDEIDGVIGERELTALYRVIDGRYANGKITVIASNLRPEQLSASIGARTFRRINSRCGTSGFQHWAFEEDQL